VQIYAFMRRNTIVKLQPTIWSLCYRTTGNKSGLTTIHQRNHLQLQPQCYSCLFSNKTSTSTLPNEFQPPQLPQHQLDVEELRVQQQEQPTEQRKRLIACKIYMNVGGDASHVPVMNDLLLYAQNKFATNASTSTITTSQQNEGDETTTATTTTSDTNVDEPKVLDYTSVGALVRVDMDPLSNRSSLHLAGPVMDVIAVTNELIEMALPAFQTLKRGCKVPPDAKTLKAIHKVVDVLEHVSFLPLLPEPQSKITDNKKLYPPLWVPTYTSYAARKVGAFIREKMNIQVFFYAYAQRNNLPLESIVDRRMKQFSLLKNIPQSTLVGAFPDYVEDVHVLLAAQCGKQRIRELVALLNNTDTGLTDVVAMANLYDLFRWYIHCRLLRPHLSGSNMAAIEHVMKRWNELQKGKNDQIPIEYVVKCFRVGPTYDECINALHKVSKSEKDRLAFDQDVRATFQSYANYYTTSST
jgi:hypothetical protein